MLLIFFYCLLDASGLVEEGGGSDHEKMSIVKILTIVIFGEWETLKRKGTPSGKIMLLVLFSEV